MISRVGSCRLLAPARAAVHSTRSHRATITLEPGDYECTQLRHEGEEQVGTFTRPQQGADLEPARIVLVLATWYGPTPLKGLLEDA